MDEEAAIIDEIERLGPVQCGTDAARHYGFDQGFRNLNHGSFGTFPKIIQRLRRHYQDRTEARPDDFLRYEHPERLDAARACIADYVHAPVDTCVFVPNATTGINTVLRNLVFRPGDVILHFSTIYGACEKTIVYLAETTPVARHRIEHGNPIADRDLARLLEEAIQALRARALRPRLVLFDTVVSLPGVRAPFHRLLRICRAHGLLSCVDGAHGVGHIPLDLPALDPDFFVSNCHKWLDVPRGCALLYVPFRNQGLMRSTLPTSHGFVPLPSSSSSGAGAINNPLPPSAKGEFVTNFEYVGSLDSTPYLCVPAALRWRAQLAWGSERGDAAHYRYCGWLARRAGEIVAAGLGTEALSNASLNAAADGVDGAGDSLGRCNFANVRLPLSLSELVGEDDTAAAVAVAEGVPVRVGVWITNTLVREYSTFIALLFFGNAWWVRLSSQVYLTEADFEWAAKTLLEVCGRVKKGEWNQKRAKEKL